VTTSSIELREVSLELGGELILENISISVRAGQTLVLIGPSGHGKSLLLKLMAGIYTPTRGEVWVEGKRLADLYGRERESLMRRMGMLFQKNALFDSLTVTDNICFPLREVSQLSESEIQTRAQEFLTAVGLESSGQRFPDEISGGMQKRLGIARALALEPDIIFYDDPTAGLDPITSRRIIELILELKKKRGSTVVAITNEMARAYQMADRIAMVVDKSVIETGSVEQTKHFDDPRVRQFIRGELTGPLMEVPS